MYIKEITYKDFNDMDRTEKFYFRLSQSELTEMDCTTEGGMLQYIERITSTQDKKELIKLFKELILKSYGVKSDDGKRFIKSEELSKEFSETNAYDKLFMLLATDATEAAKFANGIMPAELMDKSSDSDKAALLSQIPQKIEESQKKD